MVIWNAVCSSCKSDSSSDACLREEADSVRRLWDGGSFRKVTTLRFWCWTIQMRKCVVWTSQSSISFFFLGCLHHAAAACSHPSMHFPGGCIRRQLWAADRREVCGFSDLYNLLWSSEAFCQRNGMDAQLWVRRFLIPVHSTTAPQTASIFAYYITWPTSCNSYRRDNLVIDSAWLNSSHFIGAIMISYWFLSNFHIFYYDIQIFDAVVVFTEIQVWKRFAGISWGLSSGSWVRYYWKATDQRLITVWTWAGLPWRIGVPPWATTIPSGR